MANFEEVYSELKGRTGLEQEMEKDLCNRIAIIEDQGNIVEPLHKADWLLAIVLIAVVGLIPVFIEAFIIGIH